MQMSSTAPSAQMLPGGFIEVAGPLIRFVHREATFQLGDRLANPKCSRDIEENLSRAAVAYAMFRANETGILDAADLECIAHLAEIAATVAEIRAYSVEELARSRREAQDYIAGNDEGKRFTMEPENREENIAEYRRVRRQCGTTSPPATSCST